MGKRIGDYEVVTELARGGMGVVYRARELSTGRDVALKEVFHPDERFAQEAEAIARLDHPGIVRVHRFDPHAQPPYLVMELVEGVSLEARVREGVAVEEVLHVAPLLCEALAHAHERGVLHRDLKPANVLLTAAGEPKLTDFGLGKVVDQSQHLTQTGEILGTPAFMAPEQATGLVDRVGAPADVYGLGATLYAALTGQAPFHSRSMVEVLYAVLHKPATPPSALRPDVPRWLDAVVLRCLEKDPAARYPDPLAVRDALVAGPAGAPRTSPAGRFALAGLAVCALALALALLGSPPTRGPSSEPGQPVEAASGAGVAGEGLTPPATPREAEDEPGLRPRLWSHADDGDVGVAFDGLGRLWTVGEGVVRSWDLASGERLMSRPLPTVGHTLAVPEPGVVWAARTRGPGVLRLTAETTEVLFKEAGRVALVACGPKGRAALITGEDQLILHKPDDSLYTINEAVRSWSSPTFHPTDDVLAVVLEHAERDHKDLLVWDLDTRAELRRYAQPRSEDRRLRVAIYTPAGELIQGTSDGQFEFLGPRGMAHRLVSRQGWNDHTIARSTAGSPRAVAVLGDLLVTVARHNHYTAKLRGKPTSLVAWDLELRRRIGDSLLLEVDDVESLALSPDGRWAAVGGDDGEVQLVPLPRPRPPPAAWHLQLDPERSVGVAFDGLGDLVTVCGDTVQLWDPRSHDAKWSLELPTGHGACVAWGESGGLIARGDQPMIWLRGTGDFRELEGVHARRVVASRSGVIYAGERPGGVDTIGVNLGVHELDLGGAFAHRGGVTLDPGGDLLALTAGVEGYPDGQGKRLVVVDAATREVLLNEPILHRGRALAFDGERVFVGTSTGQIYVHHLDGDPSRWLDHTRVTSWADRAVGDVVDGFLPGAHGGEVYSLAWFGRRLYSVGTDADRVGELKAWSRGRLLWTQRLDFEPEDLALAVSPDGQWIAVGGRGGQVRVYPTWGHEAR